MARLPSTIYLGSVAQQAEATDLKSVKCGFDPHPIYVIEKLASKLGYSIEDTEHWLECDSCGTDWDGSYLCPDAPSNAAYREAHKDDPPSATAQMMQGIYGPIIKRQLESLSLFKEMFHG